MFIGYSILFVVFIILISRGHWSASITSHYIENEKGEKMLTYRFGGGTRNTLRGNTVGKLLLLIAQKNFNRSKYQTKNIS